MATRSERLNQLAIASPCAESWQKMVEGEGARFCRQCQKHVHDLAALEPLEIEALIEATGGRFCARITRDGLGRTITRRPARELVALPLRPALLSRRRASPGIAAVATALLALTGTGWAETPIPAPAVISDTAPDSPRSPGSGGALFRGQVVDNQGLPLPGSTVTLRHFEEGWKLVAVTDWEGKFQFSFVPSSVYHVEVTLEGFDFDPIPEMELGLENQHITFTAAPWPADATTVTLGEVWMPESVPLQDVLRDSHVVATGVVGPSVTLRELGPGGIVSEVRTELRITSILKGNPRGTTIQVNRYVLRDESENLLPGDLVLALLDPLGPNGRPDSLVYVSTDPTQALKRLPADPRLRPELGSDAALWRAMVYLANATNHGELQELVTQAIPRIEEAQRQLASAGHNSAEEKRLRARIAALESELRQKFVRGLSGDAER